MGKNEKAIHRRILHKYGKRFTKSLVIRELKITTAVNYYYVVMRLVKKKKGNSRIPNSGEDVHGVRI